MSPRPPHIGALALGGAVIALLTVVGWTAVEARSAPPGDARPAAPRTVVPGSIASPASTAERAASSITRAALAPHERPARAFGLPLIPFEAKRGEYLSSYRLGLWPAERRRIADPAYANPAGFLAVTRLTRATPVSPHFTLGEFAMHDGAGRRPDATSYVVLREALVEKLELVLAELAARRVPARDFVVLSGFRAPHYNAAVEGSAPSSRHQFGDAADVIVDDDGDGRMDDLDRDGRLTIADARVLAMAVDAVEAAHPSLVGGLGLYPAMGPSGPFIHLDVRGRPSRWGKAGGGEAAARRRARENAMAADLERVLFGAPAAGGAVRGIGRCSAAGESAVLCATRSELGRPR